MPTQPSFARIETERLLLRAPVASDVAALYEIFGDAATCLHNPAGPLASPEAAADVLWRWQMHWARHGFGLWVICQRDAPQVVLGFGGLSWREYGQQQRLNLGFRFRPSAWGQGYATELGRMALAMAFDTLGATEVCGLVRPGNTGSRRVLEKLGMLPHGELRDFPWLDASLVYRIPAERRASNEAELHATGRPERVMAERLAA